MSYKKQHFINKTEVLELLAISSLLSIKFHVIFNGFLFPQLKSFISFLKKKTLIIG